MTEMTSRLEARGQGVLQTGRSGLWTGHLQRSHDGLLPSPLRSADVQGHTEVLLVLEMSSRLPTPTPSIAPWARKMAA